MESTKQVEGSAATAQGCCAPAGKSGWLSSRNILIGAALLGGGGALLFGWNWLVAAGFASLILGVLPCLVMCALGLCMHRAGKKDAASSVTASLPPSQADVESNATPASPESSPPPAITANQAASEAAKRAA